VCVVLPATADAQWRPIPRSCAAATAAAGCTQISTSFGGAWNVAVSPDGKHAYGAAWNTSGTVHVFDRNPTTGALTWKACLIDGPASGGCGEAHGITLADSILVSQNGLNVYVTGWADGAAPNPTKIATFSRDPASGLLTWQSCLKDDGTDMCTVVARAGGRGAVMSPDQKSVYVLGANSLSAFSRNTTTGALTFIACFGGAPCTALPSAPIVPGGRQLAISGDGLYLYAPALQGGVLVFQRDPATSGISLLAGANGCITRTGTATCGARAQLSDVTPATLLSPNGAQLYVAHTNGIVAFARNAATGRLTFQSCVNDLGNLGCANGYNVAGIYYAAISPDGQDLVANHGEGAGGLSFIPRAANGNLGRRSGLDSCMTPDGFAYDQSGLRANACRASNAVSAQGGVQFFGNTSFYAGGWPQGRIAAFKRDYYPVCQSRSVTVRRNTAAAIPLTCGDRNGDPVSRSIVQAPGAGTLGAINQAAGSVFYDPFSDFSGADRFTFRATAAGLTSAPASVAITVPAPPKKRPKRIRGVSVSYSYLAYSDRTVLTKLRLNKVPRRVSVRAVCVYRGRRCAGKAAKPFSKRRARRSVSLAERFVNVDLKVGSRIVVRVTKRGMIGAARVVTMRARKAPKITSRCLRPGSQKLRRRC
jgi:DNA-binding beta-propeller fold protein YncE